MRILARLLIVVLAAHSLLGAVDAALWWAFDSGPLAPETELVLTHRSSGPALRVYGDYPDLDPESAAQRTVDSLDGAGGFDRSVIVVTIPTGSGWVDPHQVAAMESATGGDVATVAVRYSAAPSAAVFILRPEVATRSAQTLLREVIDRIRALPAGDRPQLVVHGLSLGALAGIRALTDPDLARYVDAALWQGPPGAGPREDTGVDREPGTRLGGAGSRHSGAGSRHSGTETRHGGAGSRHGETGTGAEGSGDCTVTEVNDDDPVAELSWGLLGEPLHGLRVLAALPGSDSAPPGHLHRYRPIVPPAGCLERAS